jgi:NAD(P)-dependent dehydrogenase (short-subunit alcohol dehydrogenase family)
VNEYFCHVHANEVLWPIVEAMGVGAAEPPPERAASPGKSHLIFMRRAAKSGGAITLGRGSSNDESSSGDGAAAGIGKACSKRLAREGIAVGVLDVNLEGCQDVGAEIEARAARRSRCQASVADRGQVTAAIAKLRDTFGPVTVVVNNAGITGFVPFEELTDEQWDKMLEINLKGTFIVTQVCLPDMKAAKWGRIVNISSSSAQTGAITMAHYSASKGAMVSMTRSLAQETRDRSASP